VLTEKLSFGDGSRKLQECEAMGFAISLRSDHPSAHVIRDLWRDVEQFEAHPSMAPLGYPPHITLAIYDGNVVREADVLEALDQAGQNLRALTLTFDAIRTFEGSPMVLWASPRPSTSLQSLHDTVHGVIDPSHCRPHYRPGAWRPHCTLGMEVRDDQREAALAFSTIAREAFAVTFDGLDCIRFPPIEPLELRKLPMADP
jgi:2'-5' RNA ligase